MTPEELETFRLKAQLEVLRVLVRGLYTGLANQSESSAVSLHELFAEIRKRHSKVVLKGLAPALSDLFSAEYQEALEDLLAFIESGIKPKQP